MAHYGNGIIIERADVPNEWLPLNANIGRIINGWAGREDLVAYVAPEGGQGDAPARFIPATAEIEINIPSLFGKVSPEFIGDFSERRTQFDHAKAAGVIFHEAMHARHTTYDLEAAFKAMDTESQHRALMLLEESRIEAHGVAEQPQNRAFLRASALEIAIADMTDEKIAELTSTRQAAQLAGLSLARVDAGVLEPSDVFALKAQIETFFKPEVLKRLREIWIEFQGIHYPEHQTEYMYNLAREWDKLVQDQAEENGEGSEGEGGEGEGEGQDGEGQSGSGSASGKAKQALKELMEALQEDADAAGIDAETEAGQQQKREDYAEQADKQQEKHQEQESNKKAANEVFGAGTGPSKRNTDSRLIEARQPTAAEWAAAVKVGQELDKARYRDREKSAVKSVLPPGRLRGRAVVEGRAFKAQGITKVTESWRSVKRHRTDEPHLTLGVLVDISGSMNRAMQPMAVTAWVMSEAVRRVQGRGAMVYYGNDVFPTLKPGQHLDKVNVYSAEDGTEKFDKAFRSLDGGLNLLNGTGARMVVVVSDGNYVQEEQRAVVKWLRACRIAGVGVLWIGFPGSNNHNAKRYCEETGAVFIESTGEVTDAALQIGRAGAKALTDAGKTRAQ